MPVVQQLRSVQLGPFSHQSQSSVRNAAAKHGAVSDRHDSFFAAVDRVKVRWSVVGEIHADHDPVEAADRRHHSSLHTSADADMPKTSYPAGARIWKLFQSALLCAESEGTPTVVLAEILLTIASKQ